MRKEKTEHSARLPFAASMLIFGTIDLPSGVIACFRGLLGCVLLLLLQRLGGKKPGLAAIRKSLLPLLISGGMIGFNWMLLFEAYRYTSIAVATLCYYTAPVMLILASPFVFHERLTWRQLVCVGLAACGMVLVSGVLDGGTLPDGTLTGIALAVGSAVLYAAITAVNRKALTSLDAYDKTIVQLGAAGLVMAPYLALTGGFSGLHLTALSAGLMLLVSLTHTAIPYAMYFGAMVRLPTQTVALMSYLDPITALSRSPLPVWPEPSWFSALRSSASSGPERSSKITKRPPDIPDTVRPGVVVFTVPAGRRRDRRLSGSALRHRRRSRPACRA